MIPFPQLGEALSRGRLDIIQSSLEAQIRALRTTLSRSYRDEDVDWSRRVDEHAQRLANLLEAITQQAASTSSPSQFSQRLIQLATSQTDVFLRFLDGLDGRPLVVKHKKALHEMVSYHIAQLQSLSQSLPKSSPMVEKKNAPPYLTQIQKVHWDRWSALEDREVIRESALDATALRMAQDYLVTNRSWARNELEKQIHSWLLPIVEEQLRMNNLDRAKDILHNMGHDTWEEIKNICLQTTDADLRNYLSRELNDFQLLSAEEKEAWKFTLLVNGALKNSVSGGSDQMMKSSEKFASPESLSITYVLQQLNSSLQRNEYITHLYFHTGDGTFEPMLEQDTCWKYLLSNNHVDLVRNWVRISFDSEHPRWYELSESQIIKRSGRLMESWPVTQKMIDQIEVFATETSTKDAVLDFLMRYGKIASSERSDIQSILLRLARSRQLTRFGPEMLADVPWSSLQELLFDFCVKHDLPDLAVACQLNAVDSINDGWPSLYRCHKRLAEAPDDLSIAVQAIKCCQEYLAKEDGTASSEDHIDGDRSLFLIAKVLMNGQSLSCFYNGDADSTLSLSETQLQDVANDFPLLRWAVKQTIWPVVPDVSFYTLLQECTTCNINRIFQWRLDNRKALNEDETPWGELPYFSSEDLIARFGYNDTLSLSYYLREGRPSFAACSVLVERALSSGRLSCKALKGDCELAHGVALQYFTNNRITASCVAFIEMLGCSSSILRTQVAVANLILAYETVRTGDADQSYAAIHMLLRDLVLGHQERSGREMLSILDRVLEQKMYAQEEDDSQRFTKNKGSLLIEQGLEARFAAFHGLPYPERFIRQCARSGHWLVALLYCQIHGYPQSVVLKVLEEVPEKEIRQHIRCVFSRKTTKAEPAKLRSSSSRPNFYPRTGLRQEVPMSTSITSKASRESSESEKSSIPCEASAIAQVLPTFADCNDILEVIVKCHAEPQAAAVLLYNALFLRNPTLAVIAVCYEPDWEVRGLCVYLASWLPLDQRTIFLSTIGSQAWTADYAERVLNEALKQGLAVTIQKAFIIFLPDNPLKIFADMLVDCIEHRSFSRTSDQLKLFFAASHEHKLKIRGCEHFVYEHAWLASVALKLCTTALVHCFTSSRSQLQFLRALCDADIANRLNDCNDRSDSVTRFDLLARILGCLLPTDVHLNIDQWLHDSQDENKRCVDLLLQMEKYEEAIELTKITKLPIDIALSAQLAAKLQQSVSEVTPDLKQFWKDVENTFTEVGLSAEAASTFYRECASLLSSSLDKFTALRLASRWLRRRSTEGDLLPTEWQLNLISAAEVEALEKEMWINCIQAGDAAIKELKETTTPTQLIHLNSATLNARRSTFWPANQTEDPGSLGGLMENKVDELIGQLLDLGDIAAACRVDTLFGIGNKDLTVLLACLSIAEEKIKVPDCLAELLPESLSSSPGSPYLKHSYSRQSSSKSEEELNGEADADGDGDVNQAVHSEYVEIPSREKQDTLSAIQGLCKRLNHGRRIGAQFAACYRLAMNLDFKFQDVLKVGEPLRLLRTALTEPCWDQIVVAADLLETFQLAPTQVAEFLGREIVSAISKGAAQGCARNCTLWGGKMEQIFHRVLNLVPDTALLAKELFNIAQRQTVTSPDVPREVLATVTELLIRAHFCYTSACNMEGIASVLANAHTLTTALAARQEWRLMVRLLTGIQRYTEMSYVFRILKENRQFECLLRKDVDKINKGKSSRKPQQYPEMELEYLLRKDTDKPAGLKVALFEWLRRECPEEKELRKMTASHFGMYRQLAELSKEEAETRCQSAVDAMMVNNVKTVQLLSTAVQDFSHAAEYFLQANMLSHAVHCAHQAELTALQQYLVSTAPPEQPARQIILLESKTVAQLVTNTLTFPQAKIVIRAYNHNTDWGPVLFHHCVTTTSEAEVYLAAWAAAYELTPSLLQDIALRFQRSPVISREMSRNMRRVLSYMEDIEVRYRVASQLGFKDVVQGMLRGVEVAYLKDTVWQSGFRS